MSTDTPHPDDLDYSGFRIEEVLALAMDAKVSECLAEEMDEGEAVVDALREQVARHLRQGLTTLDDALRAIDMLLIEPAYAEACRLRNVLDLKDLSPDDMLRDRT